MKKTILHKFIAFSLVTALLTVTTMAAPTYADVDTPWGPERPTFTWDDPAPYATFNSITDNPEIGDERNFVRVREVKDGEKFGDSVTVEPGKTYEVYIYYHNNADAHEVGTSAIGIAENVVMKSSFPAILKANEQGTVTGTISTSNTSPRSVWDGAYLNSSRDVYLRYITGSATIHNGGALDGEPIGADYLFGDGAVLGYNKFSGILPGCNQYAGYVTYQVFADAPDFEIKKSIVSGSNHVKPGDEVTFKIRYDNTGTMDQADVVMRDVLPSSLEYVQGSTILYNNNNPDGTSVSDAIITENGINIGNYAGGSGWAEVVYRTKVKDTVKCNEEIRNSVTVSTTDGNKYDYVTLLAVAEDCNPVDTCETNPNMEGCNNTPTPTPDTPTELPNTGPVEIVMAIVIVLGILGGGFYFFRTQRTLNRVKKGVSGKTPETPDQGTEAKIPESKPEEAPSDKPAEPTSSQKS